MKIHPRHFLVGFAMLTAAVLALAMTPRLHMARQVQQIDLKALVPTHFGAWRLDETIMPLVVSPEVKAKIDSIYSQTLTRNYVNDQGDRIMLSIALGSEQSYSSQVHRPEMCYPAQGFQIKGMAKHSIDLSSHTLPVMQLVATRGQRVEPITYWVMMGDVAVRGNWEQHFARLKYGLTGKIPYGLVIRVSSLSADESRSHVMQDQFIKNMLAAVQASDRKVLTGAGL